MCKRISSVLVLSLLAASLVFPGTAARASDDLSVVTSTEYAAPPEAIIGEPPLADDSAGSDEAAIPQENGEQNEAGEDGFSALADTDHSIVNVLADNGGDYATRRDAVIAKYAYLLNNRWTGSHFTAVPSTVAPYSAGSLASGYQQDALRTLNYARFLAGLPDDVTLDATYTNYEQHGTVVMAANNYLTHSPVKPAGMDQDFYETGYYGTSRGNIAMGYGNLPNAVITGWMEDADNGNITMVGHRRWILNPNMAKTGFGEAGRYFAMYAFDNTRSTAVDYEAIAYPSGAAFPSNVFGSYYPWSITLNLAYYNAPVASQITVTIKHGATTWTLNSNDSSSLNSSVAFTDSEYFNVNNQGYGVANCIIFRPKPSAVGTYSGEYTVTVTGIKQKNGAAASMTYTVNFFSMAPSITSASLSDARVNQSYSQQLNASGLTPITWSLVSGALPAGLNLNSAGQISGTPTAAGSFTFTVKATNSVGDATKAFTISVLDKPTITTTSIASSTVGVPFSRTLTATGTSPITWSLYSGAIPPELSLSDSGTLSGTPTSTGSYTMTVKAANSVGSTTATFTVVVVAPVSLDGKVFTLSTALNPARKVDITGKSVANGAQAIIWDTTIGANQRFKMEEASDYPGFYFIKSVNSGKVLDIYGGKIADGSNIIQWEQKAAGYENQLWAMEPLPDGNYRISSKLDTSYVMDIYGNSDKAGNRIILWTANDNTNQRFAVVEVTAAAGLVEGGYLIQTFAPGSRSLDVYGGSGAQGGRIILWDAKPAGLNGNQQFGLQYVPETGYWFIYTESGMVLDVYGGSTSAGAQVIQWPLKATNNLNQQWAIVPKNAANLSQGYYIYAAQTGLSLDCYGGSGAQGSNVITWDFHGRANQVWSFDPA